MNTEEKILVPFTVKDLNKKAQENYTSTISQRYDKEDPYKALVIEENRTSDSGIVCDVCLEDDAFPNNVLVVCEMCFCAVHQLCHGGALIKGVPEDNWYCDRCTEYRKNPKLMPTKLRCQLCPEMRGIHRQLSGNWYHIVCVNWIPEISMTPEGALGGQISYEREEIKCKICIKPKGQCIQCDFQSCTYSFHVRCAVKSGLIRGCNSMVYDLEILDETKSIVIFCPRHSTEGKLAFKSNDYTKLKLYNKNLKPQEKQDIQTKRCAIEGQKQKQQINQQRKKAIRPSILPNTTKQRSKYQEDNDEYQEKQKEEKLAVTKKLYEKQAAAKAQTINKPVKPVKPIKPTKTVVKKAPSRKSSDSSSSSSSDTSDSENSEISEFPTKSKKSQKSQKSQKLHQDTMTEQNTPNSNNEVQKNGSFNEIIKEKKPQVDFGATKYDTIQKDKIENLIEKPANKEKLNSQKSTISMKKSENLTQNSIQNKKSEVEIKNGSQEMKKDSNKVQVSEKEQTKLTYNQPDSDMFDENNQNNPKNQELVDRKSKLSEQPKENSQKTLIKQISQKTQKSAQLVITKSDELIDLPHLQIQKPVHYPTQQQQIQKWNFRREKYRKLNRPVYKCKKLNLKKYPVKWKLSEKIPKPEKETEISESSDSYVSSASSRFTSQNEKDENQSIKDEKQPEENKNRDLEAQETKQISTEIQQFEAQKVQNEAKFEDLKENEDFKKFYGDPKDSEYSISDQGFESSQEDYAPRISKRRSKAPRQSELIQQLKNMNNQNYNQMQNDPFYNQTTSALNPIPAQKLTSFFVDRTCPKSIEGPKEIEPKSVPGFSKLPSLPASLGGHEMTFNPTQKVQNPVKQSLIIQTPAKITYIRNDGPDIVYKDQQQPEGTIFNDNKTQKTLQFK